MGQEETRGWSQTSFRRLNGSTETVPDGRTLFDGGRPVARVYRYAFGPNAGRWSWFILTASSGTPCDGGMGIAATEREAREACEARIRSGSEHTMRCSSQ
jgi:hypothetical protein